MKNKKKLKIRLFTGLVFLGIGLTSWLSVPNSSILAESTKDEPKNAKTVLDSSEKNNELRATGKPLILSQNEKFPDLATESERNQILVDQKFPSSKKEVTYEYSDAKGNATQPSSTEVGYQDVYVKITDKISKSSTTVPVPTTVINSDTSLLSDNQVVFQVENAYAGIQLQSEDIQDKNKEELQQVVKETAKARAWRADNGEELQVTVSGTTIDPTTPGEYKANFDVSLGANEDEQQSIQTEKRVIVVGTNKATTKAPKEPILPAGGTWTQYKDIIPIKESEKVEFNLTAPLDNYTSLRFKNASNWSTNANFNITAWKATETTVVPRGDWGLMYTLDSRTWGLFAPLSQKGGPTTVPIVNGETLASFGEKKETPTYYKYVVGGKTVVIRGEQPIGSANWNLKYVYEAFIAPNQSFRIRTRIENTGSKPVNIGFVTKAGTSASYGGQVPYYLKSLGNGRGLRAMVTGPNIYYALDFKPRSGDPYEYWNIAGGGLKNWGALSQTGMRPGLETNKIPSGENLLGGQSDFYTLTAGVPERNVAPGESVSASFDVFLGKEVDYLSLKGEPKEYNVYQDTQEQQFGYKYTVGNIPGSNQEGKVEIIYPDESQEERRFTATNTTGDIIVPRSQLPEQLNETPGTIKPYYTSVLAVIDTAGAHDGLPSEDLDLNINVYNLGATPITQMVKKDSVWDTAAKTPETLITDPVILPGHTPKYEYVNPTNPVDTSKVGMQYIDVRMTDTAVGENNRSTIIRVPVWVYEGTLPQPPAVMLHAENVEIEKSELADKSIGEIKALILKKSNANAWYPESGLSTDLQLAVSSTTLTSTSALGKYTATIVAESYDGSKKSKPKTININVVQQAPVNIKFVNEKNAEIALPIELKANIGTTIVNVGDEPSVKDTLATLDQNNYVLDKRPANEKNYTVKATDNTDIIYQFRENAILKVNFVDEIGTNLDVSATVELNKRIGELVNVFAEPQVQAAITTYQGKGYELTKRPSQDTAYSVTRDETQTLTYVVKINGKLR